MTIRIEATVSLRELAKRPLEAWGSDIKAEVDKAISDLLSIGCNRVSLSGVTESLYQGSITFNFVGHK